MPKAVLLSLAFSLISSAALAQVPCGKRQQIIQLLAVNYEEEPVATGISNKGSLVEVLTTEDGDTWTILLTRPNGVSCIVDTGQAWQPKPRAFEVAGPHA